MTFFELVLLSIALAMDATIISVACSASCCKVKKRLLLRAAIIFGLFQAFMPLLGYLLGYNLKAFIETKGPWLAFYLLLVLGIKIIFEPTEESEQNSFLFGRLLILAVATSIDALVVGFSFNFLKINIYSTITTIGLITFALCLGGGFFGRKLSRYSIDKLKILCGVVIIAIGVRILLDRFI